ncbi:MAG: cation:proton antiporter [Ignavibacteriaceae bacterium]|jgi:CPA2 family monovalent cation:H+ antiporter-2
MLQFTIIKDIVIILLVSLPIIFLFKRFNIPSILGFLSAGMIIGPYGFKLISDLQNIEVMAEIGVILLLFTIGIEVSFSKMIKMRRILFYAGGLQVIITIVLTAAIFYLFKIPLNKAVFYGMLVSLSSSAIVLKLLQDRNELETPFGRISLVILILQDVAVVPMLIFLPVLGGSGNFAVSKIILQLLYASGAVVVIIILARFLMPKILFQLARLRIREAFTVGTILLLLGTAYLTNLIGLSFAIGAFIAGLILSESDFSHQITAEILPLKDVFNSIFFVSIGLLLNIKFVSDHLFILAWLTLVIIILKSSVIVILIKALKYPLRIAVIAGLGLSQIGEFSFVLSQSGLSLNLISKDFYNAFLASSIFTMLLTPFLLRIAPALGYGISQIDTLGKEGGGMKLSDHVIIAGFGLNGRNLARVLKETGIKYLVIEMNPEVVKEEKLKGENIIYGDITREEILETAGIEKASIIVFAISDPVASRIGLDQAKKLNPRIYTVIRTRYANEIDDLITLGADEVIPEEFETSLQIFSKVLEKYHIPLNVIMKQVSLLRGESYSMMRKGDEGINSLVNLNELLAAGLTETYYIDDNNIHTGKSMKELNLRAVTGVTIIAIVRGDKTITNPASDERILEKDTLVITGTHKTVVDAISYLSHGK